ncbi:MAG: RNA polymerase sigma-70 factor [Pyrinomonadaceae bacterium]|nr:RNA polymerase sigma-70 factor [Sphingobacteriaceae bacterium]
MKSSLKNLTDEELLVFLKDGQIASFEELYNRYWAKLYAHAYKRIQVEVVSEEIVQDFFTSLWINRHKLVIHSSFSNYMLRAIRNLVFKHYQKVYSHKKYQELRKIEISDYDCSTEETISYKDLIRTLDMEVEALPPKCKGVYNLSRKEYKSNKEIANLLQISEKTVENHITRALKVLRFSVKHYGLLVVLPHLF